MSDTYVDFRFTEEDAARLLPQGVGRRLGDTVRRVDAKPSSPLYQSIGSVHRQLKSRGEPFFTSFEIRHRYSATELREAEALRWIIAARFEPTGEDCGTRYDYSAGCPECRVGRRQLTDLILDLTAIPKKDVAISIGGEIVVSQRIAELVRDEGLTGFSLRPVRHHRATRRTLTPRWQLAAEPPELSVLTPPTQFGIDPFDPDPEGTYRCPAGHVAGLNLLSEVTIGADTWSNADLSATREHVGNPHGQGALVPEPLLIISPRLYEALAEHRYTGWRVEIAHRG